jgi:putative membrane protein
MCTQFKLGLAVALAVCFVATEASAQQRLLRRERNNQQGSQNIQQTVGTATDSYSGSQNSVDKQFAACLLQANQAEVKLAKIAAQKADTPAVKQFAEQMIQDHTALANKLQQIVGSQQPNDRRSQIERQINERCLAMLEQELESKTGREFDACYVGSQVGGHMHMKAALEVLANETTGQLQQIAQDAQPTVEKHFQHAQELMRQVDQRQANTSY